MKYFYPRTKQHPVNTKHGRKLAELELMDIYSIPLKLTMSGNRLDVQLVRQAVRGVPVGPKSRVVYRPVQTTIAKKMDKRQAKQKDANSNKVIRVAPSDSVNSKGDDVNLGNSKDVNLDNEDNDSENEVEVDDNETANDYDDNPYDDDEECEDLTEAQLAFCDAFDISLCGQIRR
ncbi:hypothetical protein Tco_0749290 [Tanacetum coccineum]|uniref:Uncharacterized protein n=1 Tax=Tanacetum coccineum TaxID=301880 RepID=A0ABQ4YXZ7_9ASTR